MNKPKTKLKIASLAAALALTAAACGGDSNEDETMDTGMDNEEMSSTTTMLEPVGAACDQIPADGEGSSAGMADDPAATAASNNELLSTLVEAVGQAGLADTLNGPGPFTIFAPINSAFEEIPEEDLNALLADQEQLTQVLTYHVVPQELTVDDLNDGDTLTTVQEGELQIAKEGDEVTVNGETNVVCGNVQVGNGVVMLIDGVLMPEA
jgi:uncharacterized surface protein with fasciclin (FAS1) repeats